jgi:ABC-type transport system involved in multi-copper enzyme maturation permease subunit
MTTALLNVFGRFFSLFWLTGPIFDKELRVSSRRRRNYVLRFAYLAFLTTLLVLVWIEVIEYHDSNLYRMSRMAEAGKIIVACTVWFQFCVTQIVAVIMLSSSISDEIYNRTLGLLMTTPISSFQIVMGKLFSRLLQLILLLAISLPLLAIVRVLGGVPWGYVVSSLCVTLTTILFVGSLSLFFSIFTRRAYVAIIVSCLTLGVIFALLPLGLYALWDVTNSTISETSILSAIFLPNPYCNLFFNTMMMVEPRAAAPVPIASWPLHCGIMLAASAVVLFVSVIGVRKVALRQAAGQLGVSFRKRRSNVDPSRAPAGRQGLTAATRRILGPPVLWKELRFPVLGRRRIATRIAVLISVVLLLVTYALCAKERILDEGPVQILYSLAYMGIGTLFTVVLSSTCITYEKESRSWPLLLTTTLDDRDILLGKFFGILRRCLVFWCLLFGHIAVFVLAGMIHPIAIILTAILVIWITVFLAGTGIYFSSCFKHTTTAVIMNLALAAAIWIVAPIMLSIIGVIQGGSDIGEVYILANPMVHIIVIMLGTVGEAHSGFQQLSFEWPYGNEGFGFTMRVLLVTMAGYMLVGVFFALRAKCRFRRNIF